MGPAFLAPRSSAIYFIYYIVHKIFFNLRSQYCAKFSVSSKQKFSIEGWNNARVIGSGPTQQLDQVRKSQWRL